MRIDPSIPPTIPFHVARAYSQGPVAPVSNRIVAQPVQPVASIGSAQESTSNASRPLAALVAGVVPGRIDFSADQPAPSKSESLAFYRHPADKNSAATSVVVGKSLDVTG